MFKIPRDLEYVLHFFCFSNHLSHLEMILQLVGFFPSHESWYWQIDTTEFQF